MRTLVTGAGGHTGRPLTELLRAGHTEVRTEVRAARRAPGPGEVRFDWADPATWGPAVEGAGRVYLLLPPLVLDPRPVLDRFLAVAAAAGTRRVVLLGSLPVPPGWIGPAALLDSLDAVAEPVLLRPSAFMTNLLGHHPLGAGIRDHDEVVSAAGTGRMGWIDTGDIARVAATLLLTESPPTAREYPLTGPEALSYPEIAALAGAVLGRPVRHRDATVAEQTGRYRAAGMPAAFAGALAAMEDGVRGGGEDRLTGVVAELTGRDPRSVTDFLREHRDELAHPARNQVRSGGEAR